MNLLFSLTLVAIGGALLVIGFDGTDPIPAQIVGLFSGHTAGRTMWLVVAGCICAGIGLAGATRARTAERTLRRRA